MLVVAHHAGQPYGGSEGWWYFKTVDSPGLGSFFAINAAFFMSLFFMISAYFMPATFNKKGASKFLKERFQRLGIPLLIGFFIIIPLLMYTYYINFRGYPSISYW
ncbi:acyltransferase, partial [Paenibacillus albiflavus]